MPTLLTDAQLKKAQTLAAAQKQDLNLNNPPGSSIVNNGTWFWADFQDRDEAELYVLIRPVLRLLLVLYKIAHSGGPC